MTTVHRRSSKVKVTLSDSFVSIGWWMVMSEDEQGYAPAAFLEPLENGNREDVHPEGETSEGRVWCGVYV